MLFYSSVVQRRWSCTLLYFLINSVAICVPMFCHLPTQTLSKEMKLIFVYLETDTFGWTRCGCHKAVIFLPQKFSLLSVGLSPLLLEK